MLHDSLPRGRKKKEKKNRLGFITLSNNLPTWWKTAGLFEKKRVLLCCVCNLWVWYKFVKFCQSKHLIGIKICLGEKEGSWEFSLTFSYWHIPFCPTNCLWQVVSFHQDPYISFSLKLLLNANRSMEKIHYHSSRTEMKFLY